jgi:hypothetical protein
MRIIRVAQRRTRDFPTEVPTPAEIATPPERPDEEDEELEFLGYGDVPSATEIAEPPGRMDPAVAPGWTMPQVTPRGHDPDAPYIEVSDWTFLPWGEDRPEDHEPVDPATMFEEVFPKQTPLEEKNRRLGIREKIFEALNTFDPVTRGTLPLKIQYKTLPDEFGGSSVTDRTVSPDHVYWADTGRHVLVAWCHLKNGWRAFAVDNILDATLLGGE